MNETPEESESLPPSASVEPEQRLEDLTLAQMLGSALRTPRQTLRGFSSIATDRKQRRLPRQTTLRVSDTLIPPAVPRVVRRTSAQTFSLPLDRGTILRTALLGMAFASAWFGCSVVFSPNANPRWTLLRDIPILSALPWWILALVLVGISERFASTPEPRVDAESADLSGDGTLRWPALAFALPMLVGAFFFSAGNQFTTGGVLCWVLGVAALAYALAPTGFRPFSALLNAIDNLRRAIAARPLTLLALTVIILLAAYARLYGLDRVPAELTSDHIEKVMDGQRIAEGNTDVFFANNGGREALQFYLIGWLGRLTGGVTPDTMKAVAVVEGLLGVLAFFFLGRALLPEDPRRADWLGLALALVVAIGYWHINVTRLSLRIILMPLVTSLLVLFLIRLLRYNRRADAIWAGLVLGISVYTYQAARSLPFLVIIAILIGLVLIARSRQDRRAFFANFLVIGVLSFGVFVPLFRYATEYPDLFWRRASGRLLGDDLIFETREDGSQVERIPTWEERLNALGLNLVQLGDNYGRALAMFTYRGDGAWFHNAPAYPAFDPFSGALLIVGVGGWVTLIIRRRDASLLLIPLSLLLLLLPSALALANPGENPSLTRASGAMIGAYVFAGWGLFMLTGAVGSLIPGRLRPSVKVLVYGLVAVTSLGWAHTIIFGPYDDFYQSSWSPQAEAGAYLRGFADSGGSFGNAFVLAGPNFFDYRGVAVEAGLTPGKYPNGDIPIAQIPFRMADAYARVGQFQLDSERDLLFMYPWNENSDVLTPLLQTWFPAGRAIIIDTRQQTPWIPNERYRVYKVDALGAEAFEAFLTDQGIPIPAPQ